MRELSIRIRFTSPCLGNDKKIRTIRDQGRKKRRRSCFLFSRTGDGKVVFMPQWWTALLRDAAQVHGALYEEVKQIQFSLEIDGNPRPIPEQFYKRYYESDKFSLYEAFFAGDCIGVNCLVPPSITDDELWRLLHIAGEYYGICPVRMPEFGRFKVVHIQRRGPQSDPRRIEPPNSNESREKTVSA